MLESSPLRGGRLHKPTAPGAWSRDSRLAQPGTLNPGWSSEPLEPDDTRSSRQTLRAQHSVTRAREPSILTASRWAQTCTADNGPGRGSAARLVRSANQTRASSTLTVSTVELSTGSDCSTRLIRTKTESFTVRLGLSRAAPALRDQLYSDLQPFQRLPSHCGAERFKGLGTMSRQSNVMSTAFRHSCLVPSSSTALSSARACSCSPIRPFLAETEHFTQAT